MTQQPAFVIDLQTSLQRWSCSGHIEQYLFEQYLPFIVQKILLALPLPKRMQLTNQVNLRWSNFFAFLFLIFIKTGDSDILKVFEQFR